MMKESYKLTFNMQEIKGADTAIVMVGYDKIEPPGGSLCKTPTNQSYANVIIMEMLATTEVRSAFFKMKRVIPGMSHSGMNYK